MSKSTPYSAHKSNMHCKCSMEADNRSMSSAKNTQPEQWRFYVRTVRGTAPPPSKFNNLPPPPPNCIALIFVCPSIIAQEQLGQIKDDDGWILLWR